MKKRNVLLFQFLLIPILASCGKEEINAHFNEFLVDKVHVGETINFADALEYDDGLNISLTYSNDFVKNEEYDSLYFVPTKVAKYDFVFEFSNEKSSKILNCSVNVVPLAPSIETNNIACFFNKGDIVSFNELFNESGIDAMPFGYVDVRFNYVEYYSCYSADTVKLSLETTPVVKTLIDKNTDSFTFSEYGKYIFGVDIYNSEGSISTTIQVSVFENHNEPIEGYSFSGLIKGSEEDVIQLVKNNSSSKLSYFAYEDALELEEDKIYTMSCDFIGKNAPQIMLGFDSLDGKKYVGNGYIISLEEDTKNQFGIYGDQRLNSTNLSPSRSEGNTICRKTLLDGNLYKWNVIFRLTKSANGETNLAIMSELFLNGSASAYRTYKWASVKASNLTGARYFGYLGSSLDDVIMRYSSLSIQYS